MCWSSWTTSQGMRWPSSPRTRRLRLSRISFMNILSQYSACQQSCSVTGTNFTSVLVEELCSAFGIQKCRTTTYHAQCNAQVERFHQRLFQMIGKLAMDKKAQWEQHLPELLQAYNSTRSVVMGYLPTTLCLGGDLTSL